MRHLRISSSLCRPGGVETGAALVTPCVIIPSEAALPAGRASWASASSSHAVLLGRGKVDQKLSCTLGARGRGDLTVHVVLCFDSGSDTSVVDEGRPFLWSDAHAFQFAERGE